MVWAAVAMWRRPQLEPDEPQDAAGVRLLVMAAMVPWTVFLAFSVITKVQPNWPVLAVFPGSALLVGWLRRRIRTEGLVRRTRGAVIAGTVLGLTMVVVMHRTDLLMPLFARMAAGAPPWELTPVAKYDPAARLRGWAQLGQAVGEILEQEHRRGRDPFIVTDDYQVTSEIAFYCPGQPAVYCLQSALGDRFSQYDLWTNPIRDAEQFVGRPCIYVGARKPALTGDGIEGPGVMPGLTLVRGVNHKVRGQRIRLWPIHLCDAYAGFGSVDASTRYRY
jgi:hypothetical protein